MEQIAEWHFGNDLEAAKEAMKATQGMTLALYHLDDIPEVDTTAGAELVDAANSGALEGEKHTFWSIMNSEDPGSAPIPLPGWFQS